MFNLFISVSCGDLLDQGLAVWPAVVAAVLGLAGVAGVQHRSLTAVEWTLLLSDVAVLCFITACVCVCVCLYALCVGSWSVCVSGGEGGQNGGLVFNF